MRPITKILLLAVVAFIVYLIWPSKPDIAGFNPGELAGLDVKTWVAEKHGKGFDALKTRFKIYNSQYKFPPVASFRIAQNEGGGIDALMKSFPKEDGGAPDSMEENRALLALTQKYVMIKKQTGGDFNPDELAREEVAWRALEHAGARAEDVALPMSKILAAIYGGEPVDYEVVAIDTANARSLIFSDEIPQDVTDPVQTAEDFMREANALLKELAVVDSGLPQE